MTVQDLLTKMTDLCVLFESLEPRDPLFGDVIGRVHGLRIVVDQEAWEWDVEHKIFVRMEECMGPPCPGFMRDGRDHIPGCLLWVAPERSAMIKEYMERLNRQNEEPSHEDTAKILERALKRRRDPLAPGEQ